MVYSNNKEKKTERKKISLNENKKKRCKIKFIKILLELNFIKVAIKLNINNKNYVINDEKLILF